MYNYSEVMMIVSVATIAVVAGTWLAVALIKGGK